MNKDLDSIEGSLSWRVTYYHFIKLLTHRYSFISWCLHSYLRVHTIELFSLNLDISECAIIEINYGKIKNRRNITTFKKMASKHSKRNIKELNDSKTSRHDNRLSGLYIIPHYLFVFLTAFLHSVHWGSFISLRKSIEVPLHFHRCNFYKYFRVNIRRGSLSGACH